MCLCIVVGGTTCCLRRCWSSLSEHVSPQQSWSPTVRPRVTALNRNSGQPRLQHGSSDGTSSLCVGTGLQGRQSTLIATVLKVGALRVALVLVLRRIAFVGTSVFVVSVWVGASWGVLTFKRARGRPPGGPRDGLLDKRRRQSLPE